MTHFRIRAAASADLKGIARYTEKNWGRQQRNKYLTDFDQAFYLLADNSDIGTACDEIKHGYRVLSVGNHLVFYKQGSDGVVEIIRVLHKRMDVSSRL